MSLHKHMKHVEYVLFMLVALGLRVNKQCTTTSDTVCEPLEGFHCVSFVRLSCDIAQKHKRCKPGQYISQKGRFVFYRILLLSL